MSYVLKIVKPKDLQNWIKTNAVGSLKATARESWRAYLLANSGTGASIAALEATFLKAQGSTGKNLHDLWGSYASVVGSAGSKNKEKIRNLYK